MLCESVLEKNLESAGYIIVYPEKLSIVEQVRAFRTSQAILLSEGSSFHLLALVASADQRIGIIARRNSVRLFTRQIKTFSGVLADELHCLSGFYYPPLHPYPTAIAAALLDFKHLYSELATKGYVEADLIWREPSEEEINTEINHYATKIPHDVILSHRLPDM